MSSQLNPLLRNLSQYDYCSIGALYLMEYQELQSYVQKMSIDAIKSNLIAIDAMCKAIRLSKNFKSWKNLVSHAKLTAKAAGEMYFNTIPNEVNELPVDFALEPCMDIWETNNMGTNWGAQLYYEKAMGQFGSLEEILSTYLKVTLEGNATEIGEASMKAVSNLEYMKPRIIMKSLIKIQRFLSSRPTKIQHLYKDIILEGTNTIPVEEVPEVYSLGFCNYELHRTIFLFVAPLLNKGWPYALICYRLRKEIIKNNPRSLVYM